MGTSKSRPVDMTRVSEIATEASGTFSKEFPLAYKYCIVEAEKRKAAPPVAPHERSLMVAASPSQIIKRGELYKLGAINKSWKKRFFTAHNKANNFVIEYADDDIGNKKGHITCFGYVVEPFTEEETQRLGENGFKLKHYDDAKRCWMLRAEDQDELSVWMEVFSYACRHSTLESTADELQTAAFAVAYRGARASYGYFGPVKIVGTEVEMLELLVDQILRRELLDEYVATETVTMPAASKKAFVANMDKEVERVVKPIVASTWRSCVAVCQLRVSFEKTVSTNMEALLKTEALVIDVVRSQVHVVADPVLFDMQSVLGRLLDCMTESVIRAFEEVIRGFYAEMQLHLPAISADRSSLEQEIALADESVEKINAGPLERAQAILWKMFTEDLAEVTDIIEPSGLTAYHVYNILMDSTRALTRDAIFSFQELAKADWQGSTAAGEGTDSSSDYGVKNLLRETISKLNADAKKVFRKCMTHVLRDLMESTVQEMLCAPSSEIIQQPQVLALVPKSLNGVFNASLVGEAYIRDLVDKFLDLMLESTVQLANARLNKMTTELVDMS